MKINLTDKYKTRSGHPVTVYAVDLNNGDHPVLAVVHYNSGDMVNLYKKDGSTTGCEAESDLIKVSPYDHIKIDDKVLVWNYDGTKKYKRYFAGINSDGRPTSWNDGTTSWNATGATSWNHCEKVED